jgi:molecular chaperone DnaK
LLPPAVVTDLAWRFLEQRQRWEARRAEQGKLKLISHRIARLAALSGDCETAWRELRQRKAAFRPGRGPLDAATQAVLGDLFSREQQVEAEVQALPAVLGDLRRNERALQAMTADAGGGRDGDGLGPADADVLAELLGTQLRLASGLLATLGAWNGALIAASAASASPLALFRGRHEAGNYRAALDSLPGPVEALADVRRQLHCLAEVGDAEGYRGVLAAHGGRLGALPVMPSATEEFAALARRGLVRVRVTRPDGNQVTGAGFLAAEDVVVTSGPLVAAASFGDPSAPTAAVQVETVAGAPAAPLAEIRTAGNVAVLRLSGPGGGMVLRPGYSALVRVGDVTAAVAFADPGDQPGLRSGLVEGFLPLPGSGISVFKIAMDLPDPLVGGPLFNELGEVIAVITSVQRQGAVAAFAVTVDSVSELLTAAGVAPRYATVCGNHRS